MDSGTNPTTATVTPASSSAPVREHIRELRRRLLVVVACLFVGAGLGFWQKDFLIWFVQKPLGEPLYYTSPQGGFTFVMAISLLAGAIAALPVLVYNLLRFVEPAGQRPLGRRLIAVALMGSVILAAAGATFAYLVGLPLALHFFSQIGTPRLQALISADQYLKFVIGQVAVFMMIFQLPLMVLVLGRISPLTSKVLAKGRKWVIVAAFAIGVVLPMSPDPVTQFMLATPIIMLYELSIWLLYLMKRPPKVRPAPPPATPEPIVQPLPAPAVKPRRPQRPVPGRVIDLSEHDAHRPPPPD